MIGRKKAFKILDDIKKEELANGREESTWYQFYNHAYGAGLIASRIAEKIEGMNAERAFVFGLLHDYGRTREDREKLRFHPVIGYDFFKDKDPGVARACLLHMFPYNEIPSYEKMKRTFFYKKDDYDLVADFVAENYLSEYDLLIQLADALADSRGFVTLEQRKEDVEKRHGIKIPESRIEPVYRMKNFFESKIGMSVYDLFEGDNEGFIYER